MVRPPAGRRTDQAHAQTVMKKHMAQYAPEDPHYETITDERTGKTKRVKVSIRSARHRTACPCHLSGRRLISSEGYRMVCPSVMRGF